jgi:hypothetical protein
MMAPMRDRKDQWVLAWELALCGLTFFVLGHAWPEAMHPDTYGMLAYDIDAETWGMGFLAGGVIWAYGVHINGRWRWSAVLRVAGVSGLLGLFGYLIVSAATAPGGAVIVIFGSIVFVPRLLRHLRTNIRDLWVRR